MRLSKLQRSILGLLLRNEMEWDRDRLYYAEIMADHFGLPADPRVRRPDGEYINSYHFNRLVVGRGRYAAVQASLSRSTARLRDRGLVTCFQGLRPPRSWVTLTDAGREEAKLREAAGE